MNQLIVTECEKSLQMEKVGTLPPPTTPLDYIMQLLCSIQSHQLVDSVVS